MARMASALACLGAAASLVATTSCVKDDKSTQITVAIWSEAQVPGQLNAIEVKVLASDGSGVAPLLITLRRGCGRAEAAG